MQGLGRAGRKGFAPILGGACPTFSLNGFRVQATGDREVGAAGRQRAHRQEDRKESTEVEGRGAAQLYGMRGP